MRGGIRERRHLGQRRGDGRSGPAHRALRHPSMRHVLPGHPRRARQGRETAARDLPPSSATAPPRRAPTAPAGHATSSCTTPTTPVSAAGSSPRTAVAPRSSSRSPGPRSPKYALTDTTSSQRRRRPRDTSERGARLTRGPPASEHPVGNTEPSEPCVRGNRTHRLPNPMSAARARPGAADIAMPARPRRKDRNEHGTRATYRSRGHDQTRP